MAVHNKADIQAAADKLGLPLGAQNHTRGYDGKGQFVVKSADQIDTAWAELWRRKPSFAFTTPLIAEGFIH